MSSLLLRNKGLLFFVTHCTTFDLGQSIQSVAKNFLGSVNMASKSVYQLSARQILLLAFATVLTLLAARLFRWDTA